MAEHKGFDPSSKKLRELRRSGKLPKSVSFTQGLVFLAILFNLFNELSNRWLKARQMIEWCLSVPLGSLGVCSANMGSETLWVLFSSLFSGAIAALLAEVVQVKFTLIWDPIKPKLERFNPVNGFKRMFQGFCGSWKLFLKLILVLMLGMHFILKFSELEQGVVLILDIEQLCLLLKQVIRLFYFTAMILLCYGAFEYLFIRKQFKKENSMSLDEVRREYKEEEGDPHVKAQRKALHEATVMQEMVRRVRLSKVIIVD